MTGFSDSIKFGDITEITQDDGIAFVVDVSDAAQAPANPYWRMVVLDEYRNGGFTLSSGMKSRQVFGSEHTEANIRTGGHGVRGAPTWTFYLESGVSRYLPILGRFDALRFREAQNFRYSADLMLVALRDEPATMTAYRVEGMAPDSPELSEARKFGLSLVLAHQNAAQLRRPELRESLLANVGLLCALTVGPDDAALLSKVLGEEFRERLLELEQGKMVVRRQPPGEVAWTEVMQTDRVPDPVHEPEEVVRFMRTEMKATCPPVPEDREPIYRKALEEMRKEEGLPWVGVIQSFIVSHLHYFASQSLNTYNFMVKEFGAHQGWGSTHVHNALNWLEARGYVTERVTLGKAYRGKDPAGNAIWAEPETQDELERARTFQYYLTAKGEQTFFGRPAIRTSRAGGPLHLRVMEYYLNDYSRKKGCFPMADYGENHGKLPDVIVYPPMIRHDEKRNKEVWDPEQWSKKDRIAIEIETNPSKHAKQLVKNYEKNVGKYARLIFAVVDEKHGEDIRRILADRDASTYEIERPVLGLSVEELRQEMNAEESIADEEPTAGSGQAAAGTSAVTAPPTSAAGGGQQPQQQAPEGFTEDDSGRRPTRGFFTLPQLMKWHKEEFGEHQLFTGNCPCGLSDAEVAGSPITRMPVDQLLPWAVRYYNRDSEMIAGPTAGAAPPAKPAEKDQGEQKHQEKANDVVQGEVVVVAGHGEEAPEQPASVTAESAAKPEAAREPSSGQPPEPPELPAGTRASVDWLNGEGPEGGSGGEDRGRAGGGGKKKKKDAARFNQLMILRLIEAGGPQMRSDLLKGLDARPRSVTRYVHDLVAGGYITEAAKKYYLAERGKQVLEKLHQELAIKE